jgi:hypothetical protein
MGLIAEPQMTSISPRQDAAGETKAKRDDNEAGTAILRNWALVVIGTKMRLVGVVEGHEAASDGRWIATAALRDFDLIAGVATSVSGCQFELGESWTGEAPLVVQDVVDRAIGTQLSTDTPIDCDIPAVLGRSARGRSIRARTKRRLPAQRR